MIQYPVVKQCNLNPTGEAVAMARDSLPILPSANVRHFESTIACCETIRETINGAIPASVCA